MAAVAALAVVGGCASRSPPLSVSQYVEYAKPLECKGADECTRLWRRAQVWVAQNAGFKIQVATDAIIETYNAPIYSNQWAMRVVRIPKSDGVEEIDLTPNCGQVPLCTISPEKLIVRFKRDLREN